MGLVLEAALRLQPDPARRFLRAALDCEAPSPTRLAAAGVPHYEATLYCRRLESAGELCASGWSAEARAGYQALMIADPAADPLAKSRALSKLERLHEDDRPREKALKSGIRSLADAELLALLLRTGGDEGVLEFADRLLIEHDGLLGLARRDIDTLMEARGLGPAKATEIAAAFEMANRIATASRRRERPRLRNPEDTVTCLREMALLDHEQFWCLPLDPRSGLIGEPRVVSKGDIDSTDAGPRPFFRYALTAGAASCIAVHNHPTGDPSASPADLAITIRLVAAGRTLDVPLVDHLIIGDGGRFFSVRRNHPECFR